MKDLSKIKFWLFDLDNTLYDGATKVFDQVDKKMSKFISEKLNVSLEEARKIQKSYFQEYNTTLNGMIKNHKIDADEFLEFVHDVDLSFLDKNKFLAPEDLTVAQFISVIRKRINLNESEAIYIFVDNIFHSF